MVGYVKVAEVLERGDKLFLNHLEGTRFRGANIDIAYQKVNALGRKELVLVAPIGFAHSSLDLISGDGMLAPFTGYSKEHLVVGECAARQVYHAQGGEIQCLAFFEKLFDALSTFQALISCKSCSASNRSTTRPRRRS
ncbi:MAG: hypothetical protein AAF963_03170 [Bacteroidota bacterium]